MSRMGYIYLITNKINGVKYVGQTSRDIEIRFLEHCTEKRGHSKLHNAIQKYGWQNFEVTQLEECPINQLDEREKYWIKYYDTFNNGYNLTLGGCNINFNMAHHDRLQIIENGLIVDSKEELARLVNQVTSWSFYHIRSLLTRAINTDKDFLGYHIKTISLPSLDYLTDENIVIDWIKTLNIRFCGKRVFCLELDREFDTIAEAAQFLIDNGLYKTNSKTPIQSVVTSISQNLRNKTDHLNGINGHLTFVYMPGTTKRKDPEFVFEKQKIYCPQLDLTFDSQKEAAKYLIENHIWVGIKEKTARLRISDIIRGAFPEYKGYTFVKV